MPRKQILLHHITLSVVILLCYGAFADDANTDSEFLQAINSLTVTGDCKAGLTSNVKGPGVDQRCAQLLLLKPALMTNFGCDVGELVRLEGFMCGTTPDHSAIQTITGLDTTQTNITSHSTGHINATQLSTAQIQKSTTMATTLHPTAVQRQRALDYIDNNVKSEDCKQFLLMAAEVVPSLEEACAFTERETVYFDHLCSAADMSVIKTAVCVYEATTTSSPEQEITVYKQNSTNTDRNNFTHSANEDTDVSHTSTSHLQILTTTATTKYPILLEQKQKALDYINKNVKSEVCKNLMLSTVDTVSSLKEACDLTVTLRAVLEMQCTEADIRVIQAALCIVEVTTTMSTEQLFIIQNQKVIDYINTTVKSEDCKQLVLGAAVALPSLEELCRLTESQKEFLNSICSGEDIAVIETAFCVNDTAVVPSTTSALSPEQDITLYKQNSAKTDQNNLTHVNKIQNNVSQTSATRLQTLTTMAATKNSIFLEQNRRH